MPPTFDQDLSFAQRVEDLAVEQLIYYPAGDCRAICRKGRKRELKLSQYPFSQGDPGAMNAVLAPTAPIQACTFLAINSAPLSIARQCMFTCMRGGPYELGRTSKDKEIGQSIDHIR